MDGDRPDRTDPGSTEVRTTCPYCGVGCGIVASLGADGTVAIRGDETHPANFGRLCSKGAALGETIDLDGRLLYPEIGGRQVGWDTALDAVADGFARTRRDHGPGAIAFYLSGQLLTEDYYVANKLMKGFLGSGNVDTNSRLCMASAVAGHRRAFGSDTVPGCYEDFDSAELVVLVGANAAWCHPVLFQRIARAREANPAMRVVVVDPRRTATCDLADLHLALRPGTDAVLFNGLLVHLAEHGHADRAFVRDRTAGLDEALAAARHAAAGTGAVAAACGLAESEVVRFFRLFAATGRSVTAFSQGINQSSSGTDKVNAILNCHLLTGRIGRPGMGPFSLTGQPNAMGGREVGGLANQLAAHMVFERPEDRDRVRRFWQVPDLAVVPGLKAVELFRAAGEGRIKALWIMGTNPAVSLPDADGVRRALDTCPLVVVSDCMRHTDTTAHADILLPALTWGERAGTVTNSERRISRQRPFLPPPGAARPDWWIITAVARRMGFAAAFPYTAPAAIFREHAALSAFENGGEGEGSRAFDIGGLAALTDADYEAMQPVQWPVTPSAPSGTARLFGDGRFHTADGRARFVPVVPRAPTRPAAEGALVLNTGRVRDQWHTMTRTGKSPRLSAHAPEPFAELHPADAGRAGIADGDLVRLVSDRGDMIARARVTPDQQTGNVFAPFHWNDRTAGRARVAALIDPSTDPVSGQPESKHMPVRVEPWRPVWHGFALSRQRIVPDGGGYWAAARGRGCWRTELAGEAVPEDWIAWARRLIGAGAAGAEDDDWIDLLDLPARRYRAALLRGGRLAACVFVGPDTALPPRAWLGGLFQRDSLSPEERAGLLTGRTACVADAGPIVCSCFAVGLRTILGTICRHNLTTPQEVGGLLKAGTNCGSCIPEIKTLLASTRTPQIN